MDNEQIRDLCLKLPHTVEAVGWGHHLVFWAGDKALGGKMYALIHLDNAGTGVCWFAAGPEHYAELVEIEGIIPAPYMARAYWVTIERWDVLRPRQWREELEAAHARVLENLPRKTKKLLDLPEQERAALLREIKQKEAAKKSAPKKSAAEKSPAKKTAAKKAAAKKTSSSRT